MAGGLTGTDPGDEPTLSDTDEPTRSDLDKACKFLEAALRAARSEAIQGGADPNAVTADLEERLRRVRRMLANDE